MNFQETYSRTAYLDFFRNTLLPNDFEITEESVDLGFKTSYITDTIKIGEVPSLDLPVFEIKHKSENDPRVSISKEAFRILANYGRQQALILFISTKAANYRLSLVTLDLKLEGKKITKEFSNPRRYSFFLGPQCKAHTPQQYLSKRIISVDDLKNRFSIEVVNKEFFTQIALLFTQLTGGSRKIGSKKYEEKGCLTLPQTMDDTIKKEFTVRLIGRLIFCWFLKKKASKAGIPLIPGEILSVDTIETAKNNPDSPGGYYHGVLEPLFFEVLNTPVTDRKKKFKNGYWKQIPFLNGGLFTPHLHDFYELDDLSHSLHINTLKVPDKWLKKLLEMFETYNFTIDENTPVDVELSIEPEMLGRIFENLLAEINPETGETARKATGSYYTPRPIVEYMVDEGLKQYLITKTGIAEDTITKLLSYSDYDGVKLTTKQQESLIDTLHTVKIIDPACGSGAFPMGILQKILLMLQKLDPDSKIWLEKLLSGIPDPMYRKELKKKIKVPNYLHKLGIIRDCIFGVDIQPIAVEISKLRCFLSLIVDEKVEDNVDNRGIEHLPNLEFKFVCANSLIGLSGEMLLKSEAHKKIDELKNVRDEYLRSYGFEKDKLESKFITLKNELSKMSMDWRQGSDTLLKLASWEPFKDESCIWFDPDWMFGFKEFDIVIGNPPYGLLNKKQNKGQGVPVTKEQLKYYKSAKEYEPAQGGMLNIFRLFIVKSISLIKTQGVFVEIFPLAFIADKSIAGLRKYILRYFSILSIDAFPERDDPHKRVFEAAKMSVCILKLAKKKNSNDSFIVRINRDRIIDSMSEISHFNANVIRLLDSDNYTIPLVSQEDVEILKKIYSKSKRFNEIGHCYTGEVDMSFGSPYFSNDSNDAILLKGAIVDRYIVNKEMSQGEIVYLDSDRFIAENSGKKLNHHKLQRIVMQGITGVNEKIRLKMTLVKNVFCANSVNYLIFNPNINIDTDCLLGLFNSTLMNYVFRRFSTNSNVNGYEVDNLPIPKEIPKSVQMQIKNLVDEVLSLKNDNPKANTKTREGRIDQLVYDLYDLTPDEVTIIRNNVNI